jgi:hypothetical protein
MPKGWLDEESYRLGGEDWVNSGKPVNVANR